MITIPAQIERLNTLLDGTIKLTVVTNELNNEQKLALFNMIQKFGFFAFKIDNNLSGNELDVLSKLETDLEPGTKSKSQRLRAVLYRSWEQDNKGYDVFDDYYNHRMERLISLIKNKELK